MSAPNLRVLLAEREFSETGLTLRSLCAEAGWSLEMVFVDSRTDLGHALLAHCPDVAFLQLDLLQPDAPGLLRLLHRSYPSIPFILFADPADRDSAVSCLSMGARDFMLEGFMDARTMARALRSAGVQHPADCTDAISFCQPSRVNGSSSGPRRSPTRPVTTRDVALKFSIEEPADLLAQPASEFTQQVLQEFERRLRSCIRFTDGLIRVAPGQWSVHFWSIPETAADGILRRVKTRLASFRSSALSPEAFVFSVAMERPSVEAVSDSGLSATPGP